MALPHKNDEMRVSVEAIEKAYNDFLKEHNYNIPVQLNIEERHPYDNTPEAIANGPRVCASYQQSKQRINFYRAAATGDNEGTLRNIRHELVGHYGIDTFAPLDKRLLLDVIIQSRNEPDLKTTWDAVERFYPTQDKYTQAEEVYAVIAEVPQAWITAQPRTTDHDPERLLLDLSHKNTITGLELRKITESVDNGIIAGLRKTQNFRENDYSAFSKTSDALEPIRRIDFAGEGRNEVQDAVKLAVETDPEKFIERFKQLPQSLGGYFISADTFKETFEQYRESNETRNAFNSPVHNSAAVLASAQFRRVLQEKPTDGKNVVVLLTGIPGAGKTSSVLEKGRLPNNVHAIYEGQLATPEVAITRVQQVLDAGFKPFIIVVHTTPERALDNTLQRFDEVGRGASINAMTTIQAGLPAGLAAVREKFHGAIELQIFDRRNSRPSVKLEGWQHLPLLSSEGNHEHIKQRLNNHLESRRASISTDAYDQAAGRPPVIRRQIDFQRDRTGIAGQHESLIHGREATQGNRHDAGITPSVVTSPNSPTSPQRSNTSPSLPDYVRESDKVAAALNYINPTDRDTWLRMGMAIKNGLGESGFTLWDDWSQEADNYNAGSARDVWKSIKSTSGGYTLGTLYYEAAQLGFDLGKWRTQPAPRISPEQLAQQKALAAAKENEQKATYAKAAKKAHEIWRKASPVSLAPKNHPYLVKKGFSCGPEAKTHLREMEATALSQALGYTPKSSGVALTGRVLVVPVVNAYGIATLELIDEQGNKTALAGGKKAGAWYPINGGERIATDSTIPTVIVEGVATALSVDAGLNPKGQTPKAYVVAALSDTNLKNVAVALKQLRPHADIIIGADSNSVEKARDAAAEVGGRYTYPKFHDSNLLAQVNFSANNQGKSPTDFNDLMVLRHETTP